MIVLDASVAVAWFLPERHVDFAADLVATGRKMIAPDLVVAEVGNALVKAFRRGVIRQERVQAAVQRMRTNVIDLRPSLPLLSDAADLACKLRGSIYDATYLELARRTGTLVVTDDARLVEMAASIGVRTHRPSDGPLPG